MSKLHEGSIGKGNPVDPAALQIRPIARVRVLEQPATIEPAHRRVRRGHVRIRHFESESARAGHDVAREPTLPAAAERNEIDIVDAMASRTGQGSVALQNDMQVVVARRISDFRGDLLQRFLVADGPEHGFDITIASPTRPVRKRVSRRENCHIAVIPRPSWSWSCARIGSQRVTAAKPTSDRRAKPGPRPGRATRRRPSGSGSSEPSEARPTCHCEKPGVWQEAPCPAPAPQCRLRN